MQHPSQPGPDGQGERAQRRHRDNDRGVVGGPRGFIFVPRFCLQEQETPLHCAAWHGYSPVARALCQAGCHVDAKNREGESPLLTASARGFVDIVECLVEHGAELETSDKVTRA